MSRNNPLVTQLPAPVTKLSELFDIVNKLAESNPEILKRIDEDQDLRGKIKKRKRMEEKTRRESKLEPLPGFEPVEEKEIPLKDIKLEPSKTRMAPYHVLFFLILRGYLGGVKSESAWDFISESMTIHNMFANQKKGLPGQNTIADNINMISNKTRQLILDTQICLVLKLKLDDFRELTIDSTAVGGNISWPTDSKLLRDLIARIWHVGQSLDKFKIPKMPSKQFAHKLQRATSLAKQIALNAGKPHSKEKIKAWYLELLEIAEAAMKGFTEVMPEIRENSEKADLSISKEEQLVRSVQLMDEDISNLKKVIAYCRKRIVEEKTTKSKDKVLSLSDKDAAWIAKGNREPVVGYKPQLGRSVNGFVTCLIVPEGNAADVSQLLPMLDEHIRITGGVVPHTLSLDDGYSGKMVKKAAEKRGVVCVSISGAKGKRITPEEDWNSELFRNARNDRSSVESLMFCLKFSHNFGRVMRRGIENVRGELLEKVIVYNSLRIVREQKKAYKTPKKIAA